jgi:hypothetical protein
MPVRHVLTQSALLLGAVIAHRAREEADTNTMPVRHVRNGPLGTELSLCNATLAILILGKRFEDAGPAGLGMGAFVFFTISTVGHNAVALWAIRCGSMPREIDILDREAMRGPRRLLDVLSDGPLGTELGPCNAMLTILILGKRFEDAGPAGLGVVVIGSTLGESMHILEALWAIRCESMPREIGILDEEALTGCSRRILDPWPLTSSNPASVALDVVRILDPWPLTSSNR